MDASPAACPSCGGDWIAEEEDAPRVPPETEALSHESNDAPSLLTEWLETAPEPQASAPAAQPPAAASSPTTSADAFAPGGAWADDSPATPFDVPEEPGASPRVSPRPSWLPYAHEAPAAPAEAPAPPRPVLMPDAQFGRYVMPADEPKPLPPERNWRHIGICAAASAALLALVVLLPVDDWINGITTSAAREAAARTTMPAWTFVVLFVANFLVAVVSYGAVLYGAFRLSGRLDRLDLASVLFVSRGALLLAFFGGVLGSFGGMVPAPLLLGGGIIPLLLLWNMYDFSASEFFSMLFLSLVCWWGLSSFALLLRGITLLLLAQI